MSDETKIFTKNDKNGDKCASGGQESGLKLIFERGVAILVRPWRFPGQPKKFVFFSIKVGTINSGTSLDSREQFKKTGKLEHSLYTGYKVRGVIQILMIVLSFGLLFPVVWLWAVIESHIIKKDAHGIAMRNGSVLLRVILVVIIFFTEMFILGRIAESANNQGAPTSAEIK